MPATYNQLVEYFIQNVPGGANAPNTPAWADRYNQFWAKWKDAQGVGSFEEIDLGRVNPGSPPPPPAAPLSNPADSSVLAGHPDLLAAYNAARAARAGLDVPDFIVEYAEAHPDDPRFNDAGFLASVGIEANPEFTDMPVEQALGNYAIEAGRQDILDDAKRKEIAGKLISDYGPASAGVRDTISSLFPSTPGGASLALQGELAASGAATDQQLAALGEQVGVLGAGLDANLAAKAAAIQQQLAALSSANTAFTSEQRAVLAQQVAGQFANLEQEITARRGAISQQLSTMGGAITEQDVALRGALETQLAQLNAAAAPLAQARMTGAQTLASAINLGSQRAQDEIRARAAAAGYVGASSGDIAAIGRESIMAKQQAAQAIADARIANATDAAGIAKYGADTGFSIASGTAGQRRDLGFFGAGENRSLTDYGAAGRRAIGDFGVNTEAAIGGADATARRDLAGFGAGENRAFGDNAADARLTLTNFGAQEKRAIKDAGAARNLSYFSNDLQRRLQSLSLPAAGLDQEFKIRETADNFGNSGFRRTMDNLSFFRTNAGSAPSAVTPNVVAPPSVAPVDSGYENLGAGLLSVAGNIGNANNWWSKPKAAAS